MNKDKKNILLHSGNLNPEQIQNYLSGRISDAEKIHLEKHLAENEADAEAIEGLKSIGNEQWLADDLKALQLRLKLRVRADEKIPVKPLLPWQFNPMNIAVAACVSVLLLVSGVLFSIRTYQQHFDTQTIVKKVDEPKQIADNQIVETPEKSVLPPTIRENDKVVKPDNTRKFKAEPILPKVQPEIPAINNEEEIKETDKQISETNTVKPSETPETRKEAEKNDEKLQESPQVQSSTTDKKEEKSDKDAQSRKMRAKKADVPVQNLSETLLTLKGKVLDETGKGLPGVNISVRGSSQGVVSDVEGNFTIEVSQNTTLVCSFIGYLNQQIPVFKTDNELLVTLQPDTAALNEVVVIGYGGNEKDKQELTFYRTEPAGGYYQYKLYVQKNLQYPPQALANQV
ncbi:MAG: carboxypeptidase-like regulatory domain-containing protein, partial [Verrucomicrobia bacterium]|nr:carboxypeptidase-like regulatory domain-containing protein [Cytophagales bacterium]